MKHEGVYQAIVIGGGHNGLVAGAYLAKAGANTVVLEARDRVGGAADTMSPWPDAPEYKVTTLSYVMSLMPDTIVRDLDLHHHGYRPYSVGPYFLPFPDGRCILQSDDAKADYDEFARFSKKDADALERWEAWLGGLADVLGPLLMTTPPKLGSLKASDLNDSLRTAWRFRGLGVEGVADLTRLMTMSVVDLLDRFFESDQVKTVMALNGLIGTWAGPHEPGTGYVMAHHMIGDVGDGQLGSWAVPEGGMGAVSEAIASSARTAGCEIRTGARVAKILTTAGGQARGVELGTGEQILSPLVVTAVHPKITFLEHLDRTELPEAFVADIENWQSRSGVVKINVAVDRAPVFTAKPEHEDLTGGFELAHSVAYLERGFEQARAGIPATGPFSDGVMPTYYDRTLAPEGHHILSLFTQWVPHEWSTEPHLDELDAYADRVIDGYDELAPGFRDSILHRQVIGPYEMEQEWGLIGGNIFHGELSAEQLFHMRPAPGYADYRTPIRGLYQCSSATHGGGGVCGIPAYNMVREIKRDRRRATRRLGWKERS